MNWTRAPHLSRRCKLIAVVSMPLLVLLATACEKRRTPCRYLIPEGYVGWVLIELDVEGARPPRQEDGHLIFEIPPSGRLAIPGEVEYGWARDEYFYVDKQGALEELPQTGWGGGGLIWGGGIGSVLEEGRPELKYENFFVGSEEEFRRAPSFDEILQSLASEPPPR
jgi:hypothetical protein